jgi:hypothetical protein
MVDAIKAQFGFGTPVAPGAAPADDAVRAANSRVAI